MGCQAVMKHTHPFVFTLPFIVLEGINEIAGILLPEFLAYEPLLLLLVDGGSPHSSCQNNFSSRQIPEPRFLYIFCCTTLRAAGSIIGSFSCYNLQGPL